MSSMKDKYFLDTNLLVYLLTEDVNDLEKRIATIQLIDLLHDQEVVISTQVLNELYSALLKNKLSDSEIQSKLEIVMEELIVRPITSEVVRFSWLIKNRYKFSYWDSLIVASALKNECSILYSEDLQHNQRIEDKLTVINPLKN
jgi:predicted nucleic acid-binding protein